MWFDLINDIVSFINIDNVHLHDDDTFLYCYADAIQLAIDNLQLAFNALQKIDAVLKS